MITVQSLHKSYYIKTKGLSRRQKQEKKAVIDMNFHIEPGELVGYIGPNGAGKSTTIKMLTGILLPDSGTVRVNGIDPFAHKKQNGRNIGVIFGQRSQLWFHLKLQDTFHLFQHMYRIPDAQYNERLGLLKEILSLDEFWDQPVRQLSLGQRMRGELAAAMLHSPKILYLDEPTVGMDIMVKERIRELLTVFNQQGVTIMLTTHDLEDIERLCKRVMVINHGRLLYDGTMASLRERCTADATVHIECKDGVPQLIDGLRNVRIEGRQLQFSLNRANGEGEKLAELIRVNQVRDIRIAEPAIEEVVRDFYQGGVPEP